MFTIKYLLELNDLVSASTLIHRFHFRQVLLISSHGFDYVAFRTGDNGFGGAIWASSVALQIDPACRSFFSPVLG